MYRGRLWTMRQYAGFGTARQTNERYHYLLAAGQTGLSVAFDLPTQMGCDSDHARAARRGRPRRRRDLVARRHGGAARRPAARPGLDVDDDQRDGGDPARALRRGRAEARGCRARRSSGTMQNDMLKEYIARGTYIYPPAAVAAPHDRPVRVVRAKLPQWNTISISGYHIREAGSTAVQEVAFTLADGIAYVEAAVARGARRRHVRAAAVVLLQRAQRPARGGREVPRRAPPVGAHHARALPPEGPALEHAALPHADRGLDAHRAAAAQQRRAHDACRRWRRCSAARSRCTRTATTRRSACRPTTRRASRCARSRSSRTRAASPTRSIRSAARGTSRRSPTSSRPRRRDYLARIDAMGGMLRAIETGFVQREIHEAAYAHQQAVEAGTRRRRRREPLRRGRCAAGGRRSAPDPAVEAERAGSLARWRAERDAAACEAALRGTRARRARQATTSCRASSPRSRRVPRSARSPERLRGVFGEYVPPAVL